MAVEGLGPLCRLITTSYDESGGTAQETKSYFAIPGSLSGMDGTNFDATTFADGPLGKHIRTLEPSGTIQRRT